MRFWSNCSLDSKIFLTFDDGNRYFLDGGHVGDLVLTESIKGSFVGEFRIADSVSGKGGIAFFIRTKKHLLIELIEYRKLLITLFML